MKLKTILSIALIITLPIFAGVMVYNYFSFGKSNSIEVNSAKIGSNQKLSEYDLLYSTNIQIFKLINNENIPIKNILDHASSNNKLVIINFWASWCSPCIKEVPVLNKFYKNNIDKVEIIGIAADNIENIKKFTQKMHVDYYISIANIEAVELSKKIGNNIGALPYTVVFKNNKILDKHIGELEQKHLDNWLNLSK